MVNACMQNEKAWWTSINGGSSNWIV